MLMIILTDQDWDHDLRVGEEYDEANAHLQVIEHLRAIVGHVEEAQPYEHTAHRVVHCLDPQSCKIYIQIFRTNNYIIIIFCRCLYRFFISVRINIPKYLGLSQPTSISRQNNTLRIHLIRMYVSIFKRKFFLKIFGQDIWPSIWDLIVNSLF